MTLRNRILILIAALLSVMLALGGLGSRWLAAELSNELDQLALGVGQSLLEVIDDEELGAPEENSDVVVLVERIVEDDEGKIVRTGHRQVGQQITRIAVQVDDQPAQLLQLPRTPSLTQLRALQVEAVTQSLSWESSNADLRLVSDTLDRRIPIPKAGVEQALQKHSQRLAGGLAALLVLGVLGALLIAQRVAQPLRELRSAARAVGQGEPGVQVATGSAVSELKETVTAFNQMSRDLEELAAARARLADRDYLSELGEIGRGLAHSLRNPLNSIGLTIDRLATGRVSDEESRRLATEARGQINRIDARIRSFLTLASATQAVGEPVDLRAVIRDVALELMQGDSGVEIVIEAAEPLHLSGVSGELRAMVQALMVNAVEASESGQRVTVTLDSRGDGASIQVIDQGSGISPEIADRLFLPHTTSKADGSGMGLYLTRRLVESHYGGEVSLRRDDSGQTTASLQLQPRQVGGDEP